MPQLISRAKLGSREAFDELYDWLISPVYRHAWTLVGDRSAAEDICAEAFVALVADLQKMPDLDAGVLAWMRRLVRNKSVDWIRRQQVQRKVNVAMAESATRSRAEPSLSPSYRMEVSEQRSQVLAVLDELPDEYREALELRYVENLSIENIAGAIGMTSSATNSLLYRAREKFRVVHLRFERSELGQVAPSSGVDLSNIGSVSSGDGAEA